MSKETKKINTDIILKVLPVIVMIVIVIFGLFVEFKSRGYVESKEEFCKDLGFIDFKFDDRLNINYCYNVEEGEVEKYYFTHEDIKNETKEY